MQFKIKKEYLELFPRMDKKTLEALKRDIQLNGLHEPIEVLPDGTVIDGFNRYEACRQLNIEPKWVVKSFKDEIEIISYILEKNALRRDLNVYQKAHAFFKRRELAFASQGLKTGANWHSPETLKNLSKMSGIPLRTLKRCWKIYKSGIQEIKEKVYSGEFSVAYGDWLVSMLQKIPEEFQEEKKTLIRHHLKNEKLLKEIINCGVEGLKLLKNAKQEVAQKLKGKYRLFTPSFKLKELQNLKEDIEKAKGRQASLTESLPKLVEVCLPEEHFKTETEAKEYAKKCDGYLVGKKVFWVLRVDKALYKQVERKAK